MLSLIFSLAIPSFYGRADENDDKLLAVRKAFNKATGKQWDDASPETQERFMKNFDRMERARLRYERTREKAADRKERTKLRRKKEEQRQIDQLERNYLRRKKEEARETQRERRDRERKLKEMKRKMQKQRRKD